jgi:hypothetical protein
MEVIEGPDPLRWKLVLVHDGAIVRHVRIRPFGAAGAAVVELNS